MASKVYLGDTSSELQDLRPIIIEQINRAGMIPLDMTLEEKLRPDMLEVVQRKIREADYFLAVVTYKRAWEPDNMGGQSLVEIELNLAREYAKPCVVLLPDASSDMASGLRRRAMMQETSDRNAQRSLWDRLQEDTSVMYFADEADLSRQVTRILRRWAGDSRDIVLTEMDTQVSRSVQLGRMDSDDIEMIADRVAEKTAAKLQDMQLEEQRELAEQAIKYNEALRMQPGELVFGRPAGTRQFQSDMFVIMPFAPEFDSVYTDAIQSLSAELKLTILRGDEFSSTRGSIMTEVWAALNACRFVVADITGGNDNVFYELGIAHTLNKPAVVITQATTLDEVPFDIRHLRYIRYDNTSMGVVRLRDDLRTAITRMLADLEENWEHST